MPSASPPLPHHYTPATSPHYTPTAAHSWGRFGFHQHQPAAMFDTTSDLHPQQDYPSTDHIVRPPGFTFPSPAQQAVPPTTRYPSPMSRHPAWAYSGYTQMHSAYSSADARASSFEPSVAHKVWLLECKHCLTFLTNRGMKVRIVRWHAQRAVINARSSPQAVLLLRPHVALYSTDALPVNCSAYSARPPSIESQPNGQQPRTCECLTQTLCCHGCGTNVGYTIVVPVGFLNFTWHPFVSIFTLRHHSVPDAPLQVLQPIASRTVIVLFSIRQSSTLPRDTTPGVNPGFYLPTPSGRRHHRHSQTPPGLHSLSSLRR